MNRLARLMLLLTLTTLTMGGCGMPAPAGPMSFDSLARRVPSAPTQAFFLNFKPSGETGRYWERIRSRIRANPRASELLDPILAEFRVHEMGLDSSIVGPAVNGYLANGTQYVILQVDSTSAARDAILLQDPDNLNWEHEDYEDKSLYHQRGGYLYGRPQWRAFTAYEGLIVETFSTVGDPIDDLKSLVSLPESQSLAALPSWKTLWSRLPQNPMGVMFLNAADAAQQNPLPAVDPSPGTALAQQIEALALAAVPERDGMRIAIAGALSTQDDVPPSTQRLLQLPGVDPGTWTGLPARTAVALSTHDASTIWPVLSEIFGLQETVLIRDSIGLDLEVDLFGPEGPFSGDMALAITPPLPDQPISQGLVAGQLVFLARGTSQAQMEAVQAAMQSRGAILSAQTIDGTELQVQVGTEPTGYAVSMGFDQDLFLLGTSPTGVVQSVAARRNEDGLVADPAFQAVLNKMPQAPAFFVYLNTPAMIELEQANMTARQYEQSPEFAAFEVFDAIGLGLKFDSDRIEGSLEFYTREK